jgi:replicative DNA helicase
MAEGDLDKFVPNLGLFSRSPLHFESVNGFTIGQLEALCRRMVQAHGIKVFVVENIQLLTADGENETARLKNVSNGLKRIASEHDCTVLGMSQRNEKGKILGSSSPSQDADGVWIIRNKDDKWEDAVQPIIIEVEKCRDGETGEVELVFLKTITRFEDVSYADEPGMI